MRNLATISAMLLLAACGSNVPPPDAAREGDADHRGMAMKNMPAPTGNQDRDFARMMIAHHQGAIDMARQQVARGSDPGMRQLAREVISAQEREIAQLNAFLDRTGGR